MAALDLPFLPEIIAIRRDIHAHPELSYQEHRTAEIIANKLTEWGIPIVRGIATTGVIGVIEGSKANHDRAIGLRADMDALPTQETNKFAHASTYPGKMHACGHDGHVAMLLGAARYLSENRDFEGKVVLIFQPAEEGDGGAKQMLEEGLLEQFPMEAVFGIHNWPGMQVGQAGLCAGPTMASSNVFKLTIKGQGGHAAQPHRSIDPIMTAVQIAQSWQTIITRNQNPNQPSVLSITQIHSGNTVNIIPDEATIIGTVRAFYDEALDMIEARMRTIAENTAAAFGATTDFRFRRGYPPLVNHPSQTKFATQVLNTILGEENVDAAFAPTMVSEDFAFFANEVPSCYIFLGNDSKVEHREVGHANGVCKLHDPSYDFNDAALPVGISYWVKIAQTFAGSA